MTALDEERLAELRRLVPPVLSPPINDVHQRAEHLRRRRTGYRAAGGVGLVSLAVLAWGLAGRELPVGGSSAAAGGSAGASQSALSCTSAVTTTTLPQWAQGGFTPPDQAVAHVTGSGGDIVGVFFGGLHAPPASDPANKILWVARVAGGTGDPDLKIHGTLNGSSVAVDRVVEGGPGPSIVDVPRPGCWTFTLSWSGHQEEVAVPYS